MPADYGAWSGYPCRIFRRTTTARGTLSVDLVDAKKGQLVWQGVANGRVSDEMRQNPGPAVDAVVAQIFSNFPESACQVETPGMDGPLVRAEFDKWSRADGSLGMTHNLREVST